MKKNQRGWIDFPKGTFEIIAAFAFVGLICSVLGLLYGVYWIVTHVRFV